MPFYFIGEKIAFSYSNLKMNLKTLKYGLCFVRNFHYSPSNSAKSHYEVLGIKQNATQADVKSAYYKLSKMYHPDTSGGSESDTRKFKEVNEAYEVLGNVKTRKLYDKGFFMGGSNYEQSEDINKFYKSRERKNRPPPPTGRTPIYDYDEWAKNHYGATFARDMANKKRREHMFRRKEESNMDKKQEKIFMILGVSLFFIYLLISTASDYDIVVEKKKRDS